MTQQEQKWAEDYEEEEKKIKLLPKGDDLYAGDPDWEDYKEFLKTIGAGMREQMKTTEGKEQLRYEIAAMRGVPVGMVKFEGEK